MKTKRRRLSSVQLLDMLETEKRRLESVRVEGANVHRAPFVVYPYATKVRALETLIQAKHAGIEVITEGPEAEATKTWIFEIVSSTFRRRRRDKELDIRSLVTREKPAVRRPPGSNLNALAEFVFSRKTYERVFQPMIADLQEEYVATLAKGRTWKGRWVWLRGHGAFWMAVFAQFPVSASRLVLKIWKAAGS